MDKQDNNLNSSQSKIKRLFKRMFNPDGPSMNNDEMITKLILMGCLEVTGVDSNTGQFLYSITPKLKEVMPNLYKEHVDLVNSEIMNLWAKGYLELGLFENDPTVNLTKKALQPQEVARLSDEELWSLEEIKRLLKLKKQ